jgi:acetyl esterase/lipase
MKKIKLYNLITTLFCGLLFLPNIITAQQRYYDEIFTEVVVTPDVQYGSNYSVETGSPVLTNLLMDIYTPPLSDTESLRPIIILLHTGSFLPSSVYSTCTGGRTDSAIVELCTRFAKRGYVAAAVSYRLGWDPVSNDVDTRTGGFVNALYRGIQDAKNAVRFFRDNAYNGGNSYGIDQDNIIVGGMGEGGGHIALAYTTLDDFNELLLDKFKNSVTGEPYIDTTQIGDYNGLQGSVPYNHINVPNVPSNILMTFNMGGALVDSSWLNGSGYPMVSFQVPTDPFSPYTFGDVIVPTTGDFLLEMSGAYDVIRKANALGMQNLWDNTTFNDPFTARANSINNGYKGLFPFIRPGMENAPWE